MITERLVTERDPAGRPQRVLERTLSPAEARWTLLEIELARQPEALAWPAIRITVPGPVADQELKALEVRLRASGWLARSAWQQVEWWEEVQAPEP
jgi:hypothetical protein